MRFLACDPIHYHYECKCTRQQEAWRPNKALLCEHGRASFECTEEFNYRSSQIAYLIGLDE